MERNDRVGSAGGASGAGQGGVTGSTGAGGFGGTSDVGGGAGAFGASGAGDVGGGASSLGERAKNVAGTAQDRLSDVGSTVRERAGQAKNSLADALEAGADRLRSRGGQQLAGATSYGEGSVATEGGRTEISQRVAGGLQSSADWLRETDLDGLRQGVERQVRENPGRTLLIAVGLGYLLGKAFRR